MPTRPELVIGYDEKSRPMSAACSACGEEMPTGEPRVTSAPELIRWFSRSSYSMSDASTGALKALPTRPEMHRRIAKAKLNFLFSTESESKAARILQSDDFTHSWCDLTADSFHSTQFRFRRPKPPSKSHIDPFPAQLVSPLRSAMPFWRSECNPRRDGEDLANPHSW